LLLSDTQPAYHGMQSIGPDDHIEAAGISVLETDQHAVWVLFQIRDRVVEEIAHAGTSRLIEDCSKITAENFVGRHDASSTESVDRHFGAVPSECVDPGNASLGHGPGADLAQQAHPLHHSAPSTAKINSLPARAWSRRTLDDGNREASFA
jgi:hypothetical protein